MSTSISPNDFDHVHDGTEVNALRVLDALDFHSLKEGSNCPTNDEIIAFICEFGIENLVELRSSLVRDRWGTSYAATSTLVPGSKAFLSNTKKQIKNLMIEAYEDSAEKICETSFGAAHGFLPLSTGIDWNKLASKLLWHDYYRVVRVAFDAEKYEATGEHTVFIFKTPPNFNRIPTNISYSYLLDMGE